MDTEAEAALRTMLDGLGTGGHNSLAALQHAQARLGQSSLSTGGDRFSDGRGSISAPRRSVMAQRGGDDKSRKSSTLDRFDRETERGLRCHL